jgi:hypothetical protein
MIGASSFAVLLLKIGFTVKTPFYLFKYLAIDTNCSTDRFSAR